MTTTFEVQPDDYTNITFGVVTPEGMEGAISNYDLVLSSLVFNEEQRIQFEYAQYQHKEGGEVRDTHYPLVPVSFYGRVVGLGATLAIREADLLSRSATLMRAVYNSDGYVKYKPDGLAANVMDTYYRYVRSSPPRPLPGEKEYWGRTRASFGTTSYVDGIPTRQFEITLMTMPIATSDPTSPVEVLSVTTLNNIDDGSNDHTTVTAASVKGDLPALARIIAHPLTAGAAAAIGSLWIAKRTSGLASFVATYLTGAAQAPVAVWSTETDGSRCGTGYYRCTPAANDIVYAMRYTIANWESHKGRAAVLVVVRNNGSDPADFDIYYRWSIANYPLTGDKKNLLRVEQWEPLLLGEIDLPETEMSSQESLDLYIDICVERTTGSGTFDLDCLKLLFTDEAALQVDMPAGYGCNTSHSFFLENFDQEIAHAVVHATDALAYICNLYGDLITLEPDVNNRLDVAWGRFYTAVFEDSFDGYGDYWAKIADLEMDEDWWQLSRDADYAIESDYAGARSAGSDTWLEVNDFDFSAFSDSDYVCVYVHSSGLTIFQLRLYSNYNSDYWQVDSGVAIGGVGYYFLKFQRSDFVATGNPSWSKIERVFFTTPYVEALVYRPDDFRFSRADPDDSNTFNDTGAIWDFPTGTWHVYELDGASKSLGQIDIEAGVEKTALIHTNYGADVRYRARCRAKRDNGWVGLVFRCADGTSGSEDCYALLLNTTNDRLELRTYNAGAWVNVAAAVSETFNPDTNYYLGVIISGNSIQCFMSVSADDIYNVTNRKFNTTNGNHTSGQCGLMTIGTLGRFTDVKIETLKDLHVPTDQIQLSAHALFRTIYPFHEAAS